MTTRFRVTVFILQRGASGSLLTGRPGWLVIRYFNNAILAGHEEPQQTTNGSVGGVS